VGKNNMKKILKIALIIVAIILIGGVIYETIASRLTIRTRDTTIADYIADNKRLSARLGDAEDRAVDIQKLLVEAEQRGKEIGRELGESQARAAELASLNRRLTGENRRLGEALSDSSAASGSIAKHSEFLGKSIDRAIEIVERYSENPD